MKLKIKLISLFIVLFIVGYVASQNHRIEQINASEPMIENKGIDEMGKNYRESYFKELARLTVSKNFETIVDTYSDAFEREVLNNYIDNVPDILYDGGELLECEVDCSGVLDSSTKDFVVLVNMKINFKEYNQIFLIEYHVNSAGNIYGYNFWIY